MLELLQAMRKGMKVMQEKMDANMAKMDANQARLEAIQAETKTNREEMLARIDVNRERMNVSLKEEMKSGQAEIRSTVNALIGKMDAWFTEMKDGRRETMACQEATEANPEKTEVCVNSKEPSPEEIESESERQEVPTKDAIVKPVRGRKKWQRGWHLAAG
jgi:hypothetical protein